jgi:outer membrane protein W
MRRWRVVAVAAAMMVLPAAARAQDGFLFGVPRGTLTLRGGMANAAARGELFDFVTDTLSLDRKDFGGLALAADFAITTGNPRMAVVLGTGYQSASAASDYRNWNDGDDQPITQTTDFKRVPVTAGLRFYLTDPGRSIGSLAWVPQPLALHVGAGVGATWYRFRQVGSFIDFNDPELAVFDDSFQTSGWGPTAYGAAGMDVSLGARVALSVDARYMYARATVGQDFTGFDRIDLSGLSTTAGITFRF